MKPHLVPFFCFEGRDILQCIRLLVKSITKQLCQEVHAKKKRKEKKKGMHIAFPEDSELIPSIHMKLTPCDSGPLGSLHTGRQTFMHIE